jgi:crotonobetainyl-CoA:carnitine CoA-transferase CaiB-like acyl-CoA transferase
MARIGNRYPNMGRANCYATKDGYFTLRAPSEEAVARLAKLLGKETPKTNMEGPDVTKGSQQLEGEVGYALGEFLKHKTNKEALHILEKEGIACAPVQSLDEVMEDPQFKAREMLVDVGHPVLGKIKMMGIVPKLSKTPGSVRSAGPSLGQHNTEIYSKLMGYTANDLNALRQEGVI